MSIMTGVIRDLLRQCLVAAMSRIIHEKRIFSLDLE
jgi:hypothetical protein